MKQTFRAKAQSKGAFNEAVADFRKEVGSVLVPLKVLSQQGPL